MIDLLASLILTKQLITPPVFMRTVRSQIQYFEGSVAVKREAATRLAANPRQTLNAGWKYCLFRDNGGSDAQLERAFSRIMSAAIVDGKLTDREVQIRSIVTFAPRWAAKEVLCPQFK